jgi:hypothetical protein
MGMLFTTACLMPCYEMKFYDYLPETILLTLLCLCWCATRLKPPDLVEVSELPQEPLGRLHVHGMQPRGYQARKRNHVLRSKRLVRLGLRAKVSCHHISYLLRCKIGKDQGTPIFAVSCRRVVETPSLFPLASSSDISLTAVSG